MENGQYSVLIFTILLKKAIDFLVEHAEISEVEAAAEEKTDAEEEASAE